MDYIGLTEDEMLDVLVDVEGEMQRDKDALRKRLRTLALRDEEIEKRMEHFESTYVIRKLIAENNRRIAERSHCCHDVQGRRKCRHNGMQSDGNGLGSSSIKVALRIGWISRLRQV